MVEVVGIAAAEVVSFVPAVAFMARVTLVAGMPFVGEMGRVPGPAVLAGTGAVPRLAGELMRATGRAGMARPAAACVRRRGMTGRRVTAAGSMAPRGMAIGEGGDGDDRGSQCDRNFEDSGAVHVFSPGAGVSLVRLAYGPTVSAPPWRGYSTEVLAAPRYDFGRVGPA